MNRNRILVGIVIVVVLGLMAAQLIYNKKHINDKAKTITQTNVVVSVTAEKAKLLPLKTSLKKTGNLLPVQETDITPAAQGKLVEVNFELGTQVAKGQVIARIDSRMKELALQQIELTLQKLEKDSLRFEELLAGNATTEVQVNDIKYNYANAKNQAEQMRMQIADARIVAPISGTVVRKNFEEGEFVNPGMNIGTIVDISNLKVQVQVTEKEIYNITNGQQVIITSEIFPDTTYTGKVTYVSPKGDDSHNYLVEIMLKNDSGQSFKAGTFVYADFTSEIEENVLQIPRNALVESIKNPYIYVVEGETAKKRVIKVGRELGDNIEVIEGLTQDEVVVITGQINLSENASVRIVNN
ncbi:MAG: efflux RND transporter periplasmic adaptor subunit [Chitinophagales bacterium]|nr:efflux RND transporter periplasmic adaptor subunit [Chitinophagales bacterium]